MAGLAPAIHAKTSRALCEISRELGRLLIIGASAVAARKGAPPMLVSAAIRGYSTNPGQT